MLHFHSSIDGDLVNLILVQAEIMLYFSPIVAQAYVSVKGQQSPMGYKWFSLILVRGKYIRTSYAAYDYHEVKLKVETISQRISPIKFNWKKYNTTSSLAWC